MDLHISHWIRIDDKAIIKDGTQLLQFGSGDPTAGPEAVYRGFQFNYPKFFKMDVLCKWAWLGAEALTSDEHGFCHQGIDKNKVAVVLSTAHGCLEVDKKYQQSILSIPSPALFVYTLSNIMLGEICIRHGFKGEQTCLVSERFDGEELHFVVSDLLENRGMEACLCGWVDSFGNQQDVSMFWVSKAGNGLIFSPAVLQQIHQG